MKFYLLPLQDVEDDPAQVLTLSQSTIDLCVHALHPAENRELWINDLQELDDPAWVIAEDFLTKAYRELDGIYVAPPPIWIAVGSLLSYVNGVYTIRSAPYLGRQAVSVAINHDGGDFLSNDLFALNTTSHNFVDSTGNQPGLYDHDYNFIGYAHGDLDDDCFAAAVFYYPDSGAPTFTIDLRIGLLC